MQAGWRRFTVLRQARREPQSPPPRPGRLPPGDRALYTVGAMERSIGCVVTRVRLGESTSDASFWRSQPPAVRLAALEELRREYHLWRYGAEPRLQRVLRYAERA